MILYGINFREGVRVAVELYIRQALIMFFQDSLLGSVVQAQLCSIIVDTLRWQVFEG